MAFTAMMDEGKYNNKLNLFGILGVTSHNCQWLAGRASLKMLMGLLSWNDRFLQVNVQQMVPKHCWGLSFTWNTENVWSVVWKWKWSLQRLIVLALQLCVEYLFVILSNVFNCSAQVWQCLMKGISWQLIFRRLKARKNSTTINNMQKTSSYYSLANPAE